MPRMNDGAERADSYNSRIVNMDELKRARDSRASSARLPDDPPPFWQQEDPFNEGSRVFRRVETPQENQQEQDDDQDRKYDWRQNRREKEPQPRREEVRQVRQNSWSEGKRDVASQPTQNAPRRNRQEMRRGGVGRTRRDDRNQPPQQTENPARWEFEFRPAPAERTRTTHEQTYQGRQDDRYANRQADSRQAYQQGREQPAPESDRRSHTGLYALLLLLGLFVLGAMIGLKAFEIKSIAVKGNDTVTSQSIIALAGINPGENIFKADLSLAKQNIESDPLLEVIGISRVLPDKINIVVRQRKPHGAIAYLSSYVIIDEKGTVLDVRSSLPTGQYPLITGIEIQPSEKGKKVVGVDGGVLKTMNGVLSALYDAKAIQYVSTLSLANSSDIRMFTGEGIQIDIGDPTDHAAKAQWIACTVPELRSHGYTSGELYVTGTKSPVFSSADKTGTDTKSTGDGGSNDKSKDTGTQDDGGNAA